MRCVLPRYFYVPTGRINEKRMTTYKIEMIVEVNEGHPRKWIPETVAMGLEDGEDILEWSIEEVEDE